ncbi:Cysteine proteinase 3 [Entamoeba marina]
MFALIVTFVALSNALDFHQWAAKRGKKYSTIELLKRRAIFNSNARYVAEHNKHSSFQLSLDGPFADMTDDEYNKMLTHIPIEKNEVHQSKQTFKSVPKSVDWRDENVIPPIRDQDTCGSCYSFASVAALESRLLIKGSNKYTADNIDFSEQQIVSCSGQDKCEGGNAINTYTYIQSKGLMDESDFPYTSTNGTCKYVRSKTVVTCDGYSNIKRGSEDALTEAIAEGPVFIAIDASHASFKFYKKGIYNNPLCSRIKLSHAVVAIGYGSENGEDYYIVRNSWGEDWGENGYVRMTRNGNNQCGIATAAVIVKNPTEL